MEETKTKRRRRRRSFPVRVNFDGKSYGGYGVQLEGPWLILDHGDGERFWFKLDSVKTFSIKERPTPIEQYPTVKPPMRILDLTPLINVDPAAKTDNAEYRPDLAQTEMFSRGRNKELELLMGDEVV